MNKELSLKIQKQKGIKKKQSECYSNSLTNIGLLKEQFPEIKYVEGYLNSGGFNFEHCWLKTNDGIIELTGEMMNKETYTYFPFVELTWTQINEIISKSKFGGKINFPLANYSKKHLIQYQKAYINFLNKHLTT